jgi:hypothetical protein
VFGTLASPPNPLRPIGLFCIQLFGGFIPAVMIAAGLPEIHLADGRRAARMRQAIPLDKVPVLLLGAVTLSQQKFDHQEGFVLSRINGQWDVRSILKLCPMPEEEALMIFVRLVDRKVIELT